MANQYKYFAFISYKSEDEEWAIWLQHELEHYHLPASYNGRTDIRQDLRPVFRDIDELSAGNLPKQIYQALVDSQNLIVVCSPKAAASPWVNQEIETFIALGRTDYIFPFIVEGNSPIEFFPPSLLALPSDQERLGGDVSKNGRDAAFVKIVAGMLNLGFDSLWNRYEKEKAEQERIERGRRDTLLRVQSRYIAEKARSLIANGEVDLAKKLLLEVLPKEIKNPNRPHTFDAEISLRQACQKYQGIPNGGSVCASLSPNNKLIVSASYIEKCIRIWDARTGYGIKKLEGHTDISNSVDFSPNGKLVISGSYDETIRIWDVETGKELILVDRYKEPVNSVAFSPNNKYFVVSFSWDKRIRVLDAKTGEELMSFERKINGQDDISSVSFDAKGKHIVSVFSYDKTIRVWDVKTGKISAVLRGHMDRVNTAFFSPDGKRIVSASDDKSVRVWDSKTGEEITHLQGHTDEVHVAVFSPNGRFVASASGDFEKSTIWLWNLEEKKVFAKLEGHTDRVNSLAFSSDGRRLLSAASDSIMRIWDIPTLQDLLTRTNRQFENNPLSTEERRKYYLE